MEALLYNLSAWGEAEHVKNLLDANPNIDINWKNDEEKTPLYIAASWGHWDVVKLLLQRGANLDAQKGALSLALYNKPRQNIVGDRGTYYYSHRCDKKYQALQIAKQFMEMVENDLQLAAILNTLPEDYKTLVQASINPQSRFPDEIMNIIIYYNHFATALELLRVAVPEDELLDLLKACNNKLAEQRKEQLEEIQKMQQVKIEVETEVKTEDVASLTAVREETNN